MPKRSIKNQSKGDSHITGQSQVSAYDRHVAFSFRDLDETQGQRITDWPHDLLLKLFGKLKEYSKLYMKEAVDTKNGKFKEYGNFPSPSEFKKPAYIPEDARWASMHLQGRECIGGHIIDNVFYIVFLDKYHQFAVSTKKHT
ncbi:MAG: hypothetical protein LBU99_04090 [Spirochaetaceae bacterium]|jgi:hypothetical protein|nr:hypothetical protein [Spirochaetaceae bacterium]